MRLTWTRTWDDKPNDFAATDPVTGERVGRIYLTGGGADGPHWVWFGHALIGNIDFSRSGRAVDKQDAADQLTASWVEFKARCQT